MPRRPTPHSRAAGALAALMSFIAFVTPLSAQTTPMNGPFLRDPLTGANDDALHYLNSTFRQNQTNQLFGAQRLALSAVLTQFATLATDLLTVAPPQDHFPDVTARGNDIINRGAASVLFQPADAPYAPQFLAFVFASDASQAQQMTRSFEQAIAQYSTAVPASPYGIALDDVAHAMAVRAATDWECLSADPATGRQSITPEQYATVYARIRDELHMNAFFQGLPDDYRQLQAELSIVQGLQMNDGCQQALQSMQPQVLRQQRAYLLADLHQLGLPYERWHVTDDGLVID